MCQPTGKKWPRYGVPLAANYPYIEAEVRFACKEYACTIEDILSRRTRLAFLNSEAAMEALPRVADIMAEELGWSKKIKAKQVEAAVRLFPFVLTDRIIARTVYGRSGRVAVCLVV